MDSCDVLIIGGGPAGSSCAWALRDSGLDVVILEKTSFPRDKVCGGWITPNVIRALNIDTAEYSRNRTFQPITGFKVGCIGASQVVNAEYDQPVSFGIRRREFDEYLLRRSRARVFEGVSLARLERSDSGWIANGNMRAKIVVGAGGHFCPVARQLRSRKPELPVVAQEAEFEMDESQRAACLVSETIPELYFCGDMKGYGWCFRKGNYLNIGLGRADAHRLPEHVATFLGFVGARAGVDTSVLAMHGHAYLLHGTSPRPIAGDGYLLIGDSAGLAYAQSGEGILTAIQSGIMAAETIVGASGEFGAARLAAYASRIARCFGGASANQATKLTGIVPASVLAFAARQLLQTRWFVRSVVLDRWFLHAA